MHPDQHQLPDTAAALADIGREALTAELLELCEEFFRHASPVVHRELRQFLTDRGCHPSTGLGWFLDSLGSTTDGPSWE